MSTKTEIKERCRTENTPESIRPTTVRDKNLKRYPATLYPSGAASTSKTGGSIGKETAVIPLCVLRDVRGARNQKRFVKRKGGVKMGGKSRS